MESALSLITCTSSCVYQQEGYCRLEQAAACGLTDGDCAHFVPCRGERTGDGRQKTEDGDYAGRFFT
ncbi:MAG: hypothetical protein LBT60_07155 [Oscillospiraceae bacterium]|nr:hypothetical protein [Oscillospiraceae bacterium]